jgi:hypothetical protein
LTPALGRLVISSSRGGECEPPSTWWSSATLSASAHWTSSMNSTTRRRRAMRPMRSRTAENARLRSSCGLGTMMSGADASAGTRRRTGNSRATSEQSSGRYDAASRWGTSARNRDRPSTMPSKALNGTVSRS